MFETVIFDLDGTLLNTLDDLMDACNHTMRTMGVPERTREEVRFFVGNGMARLMEQALPGGRAFPRFEEALSVMQGYYRTHNKIKTGLYPGIMELVAEFFPGLFPVAIGERPGVRRKPTPDTVLEAVKELGADLSTTVYVGDSEVDVATAKNTGIPCICVTWGFRDKDVLDSAGGRWYAETPEDVLKWL